MDKNYYEILSLKRNATNQQIAESYRKLVLRWHPKFAKDDHYTSIHHFSQISQAYEVLSDPLKRVFYDKYGYQKLKQGHFMKGQLKGGYRFDNNPDRIFQKFFQSNNTFARCLDQKTIQKASIFSSAFGALNYKDTSLNHDLFVPISCTLPELYRGVAKKCSYQRKGLNLDGRTLRIIEEMKILEIKPGFGNQSVIIYHGQGHQNISRNRSNLQFQIQQLPHPNYLRSGNNLIYLASITLAQAIACSPIRIRTLDDRIVRIALDQIPSPQALKEIEGEGMPIAGTKDKGNLYIKFDIQFPKHIAEDIKCQLRTLFK